MSMQDDRSDHLWAAKLCVDSVVFDLDGTLWDTCDACATAWNRVLLRHGIPFRGITANDVRSVAGMPHDACIRQVFDTLAEHELTILIEDTRIEDNLAIRELGGVLYPGVLDGLAQLHARFPLFIVSNCQAGYIETFFANSGLAELFCDFECWGNTGLSKPGNLKRVIARNQLAAPVFVGDTPGDQHAAETCGIPFVHVTYGFGACPDWRVRASSFAQLVQQLLV
jgi:phosphoglycolate phosphatase